MSAEVVRRDTQRRVAPYSKKIARCWFTEDEARGSDGIRKRNEKQKRGKPPNLEASEFYVSNIHRNSIAQASPADREGKDQGGKKAAGGLREYVEIRVEPSSLLKDRAGGDLCRVGTVYL